MANHLPLDVLKGYLVRFLGSYGSELSADGKAGMHDGNKNAEVIIRDLMNLFYGYSLKLEPKANSAGFDLLDTEHKIMVQVTNNCTSNKVSECLRTTADRVRDEHLQDYRLYIAFVTMNVQKVQNRRDGTAEKLAEGTLATPGFRFDPADEIICLDTFVDFLRQNSSPKAQPLELEQMARIEHLINQYSVAKIDYENVLDLPLPSVLENSRFVGRREELERIGEKLKTDKVVYLTGLGGMGKTELAVKFGREYREGEVYFVRFQESFRHTVSMNVALGIEGLLEKGPDAAHDEAMKRLGQCSKHDILIIDNTDAASGYFADLEDNTWTALRQLPMKLLITTRCDVAGAVKVGAMKTELLRQLFRNQELELTTQQMDDLIDAVRGHTMMVDMMAKTLRRNRRLTAEHLLQTIKDGTLPAERLRAIAMEKNGDMEQEQIYVHLKNLFSMAELSDEDKAMLTYLVLLPDGGLDMEILEKAIPEDDLNTLDKLTDAGWLSYEPKTKRVSMHPVVRLVCREELKPDDENCGNFLNAVWDQYDRMKYDAALFRQWAELFSQAADILPDREGKWALYAGVFWGKLGLAWQALHYELKAVSRREENMPDSLGLATAYNNVGGTYGMLGTHKTALEYQLKALAICEKVLPPDHPNLATSYNNVGCSYEELGFIFKSLEYKEKALAILEKVLSPEHPYLASSYNNVGVAYGELGNHKKALEYQLKALSIREKVFPPEHPDMATSYSNLGWTYGRLGDYETALDYAKRALVIGEKSLPEGHPITESFRWSVWNWERKLKKQQSGK
jgi:tetratricopeptide (TPR) repeat protein